MTSPPRPVVSPTQKWSHGTCSPDQLRRALEDPSITAIEADILMDVDPAALPAGAAPNPVMAHPPSRASSLTFRAFYSAIREHNARASASEDLTAKIVKLDFKEIEAVAPCLRIMREIAGGRGEEVARNDVFLNADVLPGPGARGEAATVDAAAFFGALAAGDGDGDGDGDPRARLPPLSLGWRTHVARHYNDEGAYSAGDAAAMAALVREHDLASRSALLVFAVNFRILQQEESRASIGSLLERVEHSQILCWTGTGEPPVRREDVDEMQDYFARRGLGERVGLDVRIAASWWEGVVADISLVAINVLNMVRDLNQKSRLGSSETTWLKKTNGASVEQSSHA